MGERLRRWFAEDCGQDLIEYMMLGTFIAIVGVLGIQALEIAMGTSYQSWDAGTQKIWEPLPPTP